MSRTDTGTSSLAVRMELVREALHCDQPAVWFFLLRALAKGKPVAPAQAARALNLSAGELGLALASFADLVYDEAGDIVACGLSLLPTPHRFEVDGHDLYTWCALDTLMYPVALGRAARVQSSCPVTGVAVRLTVTPTGVSSVSPAGAVVSIVAPAGQAGCCRVRNSFCSQVHFIGSAGAGATWLSQHPDAAILSVTEAWQLGSDVVQRRREGERANGGGLGATSSNE